MNDIFDIILKIIPFLELFQKLGLSLQYSAILTSLILAILGFIVNYLTSRYISWKKIVKAAKDLKPVFDYRSIKELSDIYIQQKASRTPPNGFDRRIDVDEHIRNSPSLIEIMLKVFFNEKKSDEKFYLVLADSGMGKTAFMVNLYLKNYSPLNFIDNYKIKLLRFQSIEDKNPTDILSNLKKDEVNNTILLLDGLDEDPFIFSKDTSISQEEAFKNRILQITKVTQEFKIVVITCRTQYFPLKEDDSYELDVRKPNGKGFYKLQKYYLFPFSNLDIEKFLDRKYGLVKFWNIGKKKVAHQIITDNYRLLDRPMLISFIDDLVKDNKIFTSHWQIFEMLIEKWLLRESVKWKRENERLSHVNKLREFSHKVAIEIHNEWRNNGKLHISKERAKEIAEQFEKGTSFEEMYGKSLLTCDAKLNWKFANISILEFFLAKEASEKIEFAMQYEFAGMDMAKLFFFEKIGPTTVFLSNYVLIKGGTFLMGNSETDSDSNNPSVQHQVYLSDFFISKYTVSVADFKKFVDDTQWVSDAEKSNGSYIYNGDEIVKTNGVNWRFDGLGKMRENREYNHPVLHVSWNDAFAFCDWLSKKSNRKFRLPTEAEWEYACRAGTISNFNIGDYLTTEHANYSEKAQFNKKETNVFQTYTTVAVDSFEPNSWGLYNMHGNVFEWCSDWYSDTYYVECKERERVYNPIGPIVATLDRVVRGGGWDFTEFGCQSDSRECSSIDEPSYNIGFRIVMESYSVNL